MSDLADLADGFIAEQVQDTLAHQRRAAERQLDATNPPTHRQECAEAIPEARRAALPGVRHCVYCKSRLERLGG